MSSMVHAEEAGDDVAAGPLKFGVVQAKNSGAIISLCGASLNPRPSRSSLSPSRRRRCRQSADGASIVRAAAGRAHRKTGALSPREPRPRMLATQMIGMHNADRREDQRPDRWNHLREM